jgi:hypothetical protein
MSEPVKVGSPPDDFEFAGPDRRWMVPGEWLVTVIIVAVIGLLWVRWGVGDRTATATIISEGPASDSAINKATVLAVSAAVAKPCTVARLDDGTFVLHHYFCKHGADDPCNFSVPFVIRQTPRPSAGQ